MTFSFGLRHCHVLMFTTLVPKNNFSGKARPKTSKKQKQHIKLYDHAGLLPLIRTSEDQVYTIVQTTSDYTLVQAAITPAFLTFNFSLDQLAQYASFTNVFDQYRIDEVQVIIRPMYLFQNIALNVMRAPMLYTVIDYDDNSTPGSLAVLQEYSNCQISYNETTVCTFNPHMAVAAYDGSTFTSYANRGPSWIDAAYPAVKHYGVKMGCDGGLTGQTICQEWNIAVRYRVSFKNVH